MTTSTLRAAAAAALLASPLLIRAQSTVAPPQVPDAIRAPAGEAVVLRLHALGAQIYTCAKSPEGKVQWTLKAPDAQLRDDRGSVVGQHGAGPSWMHKDGSTVTGKMAARAEAPDGKSIPWLLVTATSHDGDGVLARVTSVQRLNTQGGAAPAAGCDPQKDKDVRVPYTADYYFYAPASGAAHP